MRPIRVDLDANRTYRLDHILFGHFGSMANAGKNGAAKEDGGGGSKAGEAAWLCQSVDDRPRPHRPTRGAERAGVSTIFEERQPARSDGRTELQKVLLVLGEGDALVVTRLDRLGSLPARPCQHRP